MPFLVTWRQRQRRTGLVGGRPERAGSGRLALAAAFALGPAHNRAVRACMHAWAWQATATYPAVPLARLLPVLRLRTMNGACSNWPFRGQKHEVWEGGVRVAGFIAGGVLPVVLRGRTHAGLFHVTDWLETICSALELPPPFLFDTDGLDQWGCLQVRKTLSSLVLQLGLCLRQCLSLSSVWLSLPPEPGGLQAHGGALQCEPDL
eukprot:SAG22_NODE_380_length_11402_cov_8.514154_6_plen_205_part_00